MGVSFACHGGRVVQGMLTSSVAGERSGVVGVTL